jgi:2,5-dihydroxypyridine 5,6-dioxygenase
MHPLLGGADLVPHFEHVLRLCKVRRGEAVLIFTDPLFPHDAYPAAALAAASSLGAQAYILTAQSDQGVEDKLIRAAWTHADMVLGMSFMPGSHSWMYADVHSEALAAGARVLMVQEPPAALKRMLPSEDVARCGLAGAEVLEKARQVRIVTRSGGDLTLRKDGRRGSYQCGVADVPGRWDHWPTGMVYCAPLEDSADGTLVVQAGDVLLTSLRYVQSEMKLTFRQGKVTSIEGGADAQQVWDMLQAVGDDGAFRLAHAGWGTDPRADWRYIGMDSESLLGAITIALGRNIFDSPAPHCGMGGANRSKLHFDICLRGASLFLDGAAIIDQGHTDIGYAPNSWRAASMAL